MKQIRAELSARLERRRTEIERASFLRAHGIADPRQVSHPEYAEGLRLAICAALRYCLDGLARGEEQAPPVPAALLAQARLAARSGVDLDTVLRRCFAGYTLLGDFIMAEAQAGGLLHDTALQNVLRTQAALFDRLVVAVTDGYGDEKERAVEPAGERHAERVKRLLAGEPLDCSDLGYDLEGHHLGVLAAGAGAAAALRGLALGLDCRSLIVRPSDRIVWAWLGGRRRLDLEDLMQVISTTWPAGVSLALGEPGEGVAGWRLTHHQARAAMSVAPHGPEAITRYADVALLASMIQDDLLVVSLRELYLAPLARDRDGGKALRDTLRTYFGTERNISSTAAALGVSRQTVVNRLHAIEERLGRQLGACAADMEAALRLEQEGRRLLPHIAFSHE